MPANRINNPNGNNNKPRNNNANQKQKAKRRQRPVRQPTQGTSVSIPMQTAYTIKQTAGVETTRLRGRERIGGIQIGRTDTGTVIAPAGTGWVFPLSPLSYANTRISRMASMYQRYRFKRATLTIASNFSTSISGSLVVGYTTNPDFELVANNSINEVFAMPGAQSVTLWAPSNISAKFSPMANNVWYISDVDSSELMWTTQGQFAIVIENVASMTGVQDISVILDYDVEFMLPQIAPAPPASMYVIPTATYGVATSGGLANYAISAVSDTDVPYPAVNKQTIYEMIPSMAFVDKNGLDLMGRFYAEPTAGQILFFENLEQAKTMNPANSISHPIDPVPKFILGQYALNKVDA